MDCTEQSIYLSARMDDLLFLPLLLHFGNVFGGREDTPPKLKRVVSWYSRGYFLLHIFVFGSVHGHCGFAGPQGPCRMCLHTAACNSGCVSGLGSSAETKESTSAGVRGLSPSCKTMSI